MALPGLQGLSLLHLPLLARSAQAMGHGAHGLRTRPAGQAVALRQPSSWQASAERDQGVRLVHSGLPWHQTQAHQPPPPAAQPWELQGRGRGARLGSTLSGAGRQEQLFWAMVAAS